MSSCSDSVVSSESELSSTTPYGSHHLVCSYSAAIISDDKKKKWCCLEDQKHHKAFAVHRNGDMAITASLCVYCTIMSLLLCMPCYANYMQCQHCMHNSYTICIFHVNSLWCLQCVKDKVHCTGMSIHLLN